MMKKTNEAQVTVIAKAKTYIAERVKLAKNPADVEFLNNMLTAIEQQEATIQGLATDVVTLRKEFDALKQQLLPTQFIDLTGNHDIHGKVL